MSDVAGYRVTDVFYKYRIAKYVLRNYIPALSTKSYLILQNIKLDISFFQ